MIVSINKIEYFNHKASGTLELYRSDLINGLVRQKYPAPGYELAIMRKIIAEPKNDAVIAEFNEYNDYVEKCKKVVDSEIANLEVLYDNNVTT